GRGLLVGVPEPGIFQGWAWQLKGESLFSLAAINDVVLDPGTSGSSKRLYVAVSSGVTASATESTITGPAPAMGFGIYKSEDDGDTWTKVDVPNTDGAKPTDLEIDPQDSNQLFAGFLGKGIFRGTRDPMTGTIAWCPLNPGTGGAVCMGAGGLPDVNNSPFDFVEVTIHRPGIPDAVLYASFGNCTDPICEGCNPPIYKSTDGGLTWTQQNTGAPVAYSRYTHVLTTHPSDPTKLLYGAVGLYLSHNSAVDFSSDGLPGDDDIGAKPPPNQLHPDQQAIVFADPGAACTMQACNLGGNDCVIYSANDGGFYRSTDSGCSWRSRNDGLQITGFQSIGASPDTPTVIGGTQDNGTILFSGSSTWSYETGGDTTGTRIDSGDSDRMYSITGGCSVVRSVFRSEDGGGSWGFEYETPMGEAAAFYPPMVEDPTSPHPLYLGTNRLHRSTTDASSFVAVSPALGGTVTFFPDIQRTNVVTAIAVAPDNPDRIYVGYYDGQVWVTDM
ncbi:MAG: WD40/YVTN/BNR-like repeat-containing protein, partial [Candidatus Polarisedimenticolia bacterium]